MLILELSAGQGPAECCLAVALALKRVLQEAASLTLEAIVAERVPGPVPDSLHSVSLRIAGSNAFALAQVWQGSHQWICPSPLRPHHRRKNWYFAGAIYEVPAAINVEGIRIETLRSSGAGGQHVNKTESAVRATHIATGESVRVDAERSQHANRRLAIALLTRKLKQRSTQKDGEQRAQRHSFHRALERGNARQIFVGEDFEPRT